jgi:hypothetical protein
LKRKIFWNGFLRYWILVFLKICHTAMGTLFLWDLTNKNDIYFSSAVMCACVASPLLSYLFMSAY